MEDIDKNGDGHVDEDEYIGELSADLVYSNYCALPLLGLTPFLKLVCGSI